MLQKAGLLGDDGKPKGFDGVANGDAALAKLTTGGVVGLSTPTADGATMWRIFYTLLSQQDGVFLKDGKFLEGDNLAKATTAMAEMQKWVGERLDPRQDRISGLDRPFHLGQGGAAHQRRLGDSDDGRRARRARSSTGARSEFDVLRASRDLADSHSFAITDRKGDPVPAAKRKLVLDTIHWFNEHSLESAAAAMCPPICQFEDSAAFKALKPNSDYSSLAKTAVFDPVWCWRASPLPSTTPPATT